MQILISVLLTVVLLIGNRDFLLAFGASENTIEYGVSYMNIYAIGTIFVQLTLGMNTFITAQGFAKTGMLSVLIGAVANIILDPIFIFGFHMGVRGAALATILSQAMSCIWVLSFLFGRKTLLKIRLKNLRLEAKIILPSLALGLSTFIMQASESVISICFNSSLLRHGGDIAVGAMTILTSVMQFAMLPLQGLGQGAQPIISYNYGARNCGSGEGDLQAPAEIQLVLFRLAVGRSHALPAGFRLHVHPGSCAAGVFQDGAAHLYGLHGAVRHPNRLPDDLYLPRQRESVYFGGGDAQVYPADPADLYSAANPARRPRPRPSTWPSRWRTFWRCPLPSFFSPFNSKRCWRRWRGTRSEIKESAPKRNSLPRRMAQKRDGVIPSLS